MQMHFLFWAAALVALPALAQSPNVSNDPANAKAASPVPQYRSAFADYRAWREPEQTNWRSANDEAGALGGHMGQIRGQIRGHDRGHSNGSAMSAPAAATAATTEQAK